MSCLKLTLLLLLLIINLKLITTVIVLMLKNILQALQNGPEHGFIGIKNCYAFIFQQQI